MAPYATPQDVQLAVDELERRLRPLIVQLQGKGPVQRLQVPITWPGGSSQSNLPTVVHDLGVIAGVNATLHSTGATNVGYVSTFNHTLTSFALVAVTTSTPAAGSSALIDLEIWIP